MKNGVHLDILLCSICNGDQRICTNIDDNVLKSSKELLGVAIPKNGRLCAKCIQQVLVFQEFKNIVLENLNMPVNNASVNKTSDECDIINVDDDTTQPDQVTASINKSSDECDILNVDDDSIQTVRVTNVKCIECNMYETSDKMLIHLRENHSPYIGKPNVCRNDKQKYMCLHCGNLFSYLVNYEKHISCITDNACPCCEFKTNAKKGLNNHLRNCHGMKKGEQICLKCNLIVPSIIELNKHYKSKHYTLLQTKIDRTMNNLNNDDELSNSKHKNLNSPSSQSQFTGNNCTEMNKEPADPVNDTAKRKLPVQNSCELTKNEDKSKSERLVNDDKNSDLDNCVEGHVDVSKAESKEIKGRRFEVNLKSENNNESHLELENYNGNEEIPPPWSINHDSTYTAHQNHQKQYSKKRQNFREKSYTDMGYKKFKPHDPKFNDWPKSSYKSTERQEPSMHKHSQRKINF